MSSVIILCRDLNDSEPSELNYDSDESSDSISAVGVAGVSTDAFSPIQFFQKVTFSCYYRKCYIFEPIIVRYT